MSATNDTRGDDEATLQDSVSDAMRDWSETGRGQHIEFGTHESVPLVPGRMLGRGAMGDVFETTVRGYSLAWKRIRVQRKVALHQRKEIEILKKLSHTHMVQLVGTYTSRLELGLILYPVAVCDLHTFFDDVEAYWTTGADEEQRNRLITFNYLPIPGSSSRAAPAYQQIGCLVSAVEYLHSQNIRHKDLKPSNILLSPNQLWLSDFGSATDFSLLSQSATDNERGTPRYFAPEVADWKKNGRAADMFSLGCVLLEIIVLHADGILKRIRDNRPNPNPAFHANLDSLDIWLPFSDSFTPLEHHLIKEVRAMLSRDPKQRPHATGLLRRLTLADEMMEAGPSTFGDCCRAKYSKAVLEEQSCLREAEMKTLWGDVSELTIELRESRRRLASASKKEEELKIFVARLQSELSKVKDQWMEDKSRLASASTKEKKIETSLEQIQFDLERFRSRSKAIESQMPSNERTRLSAERKLKNLVSPSLDSGGTALDDYSSDDSEGAVLGMTAPDHSLSSPSRRHGYRASPKPPERPKPTGFFAWAAGGKGKGKK